MSTKLVLVRHGQSVWNKENRFTGWKDVDLTDQGREEARQAGELLKEAGFEFVEASEVNANPADTADHPYGVWTLPPTRRSPAEDEEGFEDFDRAQYDAIGESDRMTLLFRKPDAE